MKKLKQTLALALVVCMLCSYLPVGALASENTSVDAIVPESTEAVIQSTSELSPNEPNRPEDGSTQNQPFPSGTGGSTYFRIPALTVLSDGTLVAAADARWNDIYDKGNIDTIVSVSEDGGANWDYTFANYIDDGGNTYNISAATFIDPAMAVKTVDGVETIYMVADLFPGQASGSTMCIHAALYGTGMSDDGHLLVSDKNDNNLNDFHYYVGDYTDGVAPLCNSDGTATAYTVDEWFNVYKGSTHLGNLFTYGDVTDGDTTFYVYQTCYLVLTKSTDGGKTWSAPTMLNHQVKNSSEKFYGVGPASGFVTSTGRIMFTAYTFTSADGNSSVFYSDDNGVTWTRAASVAEQTSEAALTEANGTIYMFTRHGCYYYYSTDNGTTWSGAQSTNGISYLDSCEVSVMTYSEKIDGKTAILLSAPTTSGRYAGKIFVGLVNDDHSITWKYTYAVNGTGRYQYSSLKELNDGSLGLLYENGDASIVYENIAITDVIGEDAVIGTPEQTINLTVGETKEFTLDEVVNSGSHTSDAADITWTKVDTTVSVPAAKLGTTTAFDGATIDLNNCLYTFTKNTDGTTWLLSADVNGTTVYIDAHAGASNGGYPNRTYTTNITLKNGSNGGIQIYDGAGYLHFYDTDGSKLYWDQCTGDSCSGHNLKIYKVADPASTTVLGGYYEQVTDVANLEDGGKYLIVGYNSSTALAGYYAMHPSVSTGDKYSHLAKITGDFTDITTSETTVEIEAKAVGSTSVEIGSTKYTITVSPEIDNVVDVQLKLGETKTYTEKLVNHANSANTVSPNTNIAGMKLTGTDAVYTAGEFAQIQDLTAGTYIIKNSRAAANSAPGTLLSNTPFSDNNNGLKMVGTETSFDASAVWTITPSGDGYTIQDVTDKYLTIGNATASVVDEPTVLTLAYNSGNWKYTISKDGYYLNQFGGNTNVRAAGWNGSGADTDAGSRFEIYRFAGNLASTEITFEGLHVGQTIAVVGNTQYNITVVPNEATVTETVDVKLNVGQTSQTYTNTTGSTIVQNPDGSIATMDVSTTDGGTVTNVSTEKATAIEGDATYIIRVADTSYALTSNKGGTTWASSDGDTRAYESFTGPEADNMWTLEASGNGYKLKCAAGYLNLGKNAAWITETGGDVFTLTNDGGVWAIGDGTYNIDALGGLTNYHCAGGWPNSGTRFDLYKVTTQTVPPTTEVTFTGMSVGTTTAIVGTTQYNVTVTIPEKTLTLTTGGLATIIPVTAVTQADIDAFNTANGAYVTAELKDNGNVTLTGVAEGTVAAYILGGTKYTINVVGTPDCVTSKNTPFVVGGNFIGSVTNDSKNEGMDYLTKLTMSSVMTRENIGGSSGVGYQVDLSSAFANAENISWSIADESIAKIEVSEDGKSVYVTAADANTTGTTYLSCTIDGQTYTIPVVIMKTTEATSNWKYNSLHIAEITRTDVWYSWNNSGNADQFVKAIEGEAIWTVYAKNTEYFSINFYGAPDPDHALTFMSATNSAGQYHTLADKNDPTNCDYYTKPGSGMDQRNGAHFTDEQVANDIRVALGLGCDGAQGFYRSSGTNGEVNCNLTFISDPVPVIDKTVDGVLPITRKQANYRRYAENMVASVNEQVYFKITVTLDAPSQWLPYDEDEHEHYVEIDGVKYAADENGNRYSAIEYSNALVTDYALGTEHAFIYTKEIDNEDGKWDGEIPVENRRQEDNITALLNAAWTQDELAAGKREIPLYLVYTIQEEDIPKFEITNTANLTFGFKSHYSTGVADREADAEAKISVVGTAIDSVVIDFGQKITYSANSFVSISDGQQYTFSGLTNVHLKGAYVDGETIGNVTGSKALAKYGTATVTREQILDENGDPVLDGKGEPNYLYTVTYTPTSILQSVDTIQIYGVGAENQEKLINSILVYPATTVYYEEGFLENVNNGWSFEKDAKKATIDQTFELLGLSQYNSDGELTHFVSGKRNAYGFDPIYDGITATGNEEVASSSISATTPGAIAKFTFTGTGFEIFANCTADSGYVLVTVADQNGNNVKMLTVNTKVMGGDTGATNEQKDNMNALPIVSLTDLKHGTYTVTLTKIANADKVTIDGVRIFNTVADSSVYTIDLEDNPEFYELRDVVMHAIGINSDSSDYYDNLTGMAQQVYNDLLGEYEDENGNIVTDTETPAAVITDKTYIYGNEKDEKNLQDLLDNGPKNELYLWPGQTLTFNVQTNRTMQVGLKAPSGATVFSGTAVGSNPDDDMNTPIYSAVYGQTDMFYDLVTRPVADTENVYTVTITNVGENILAITDLKVCDDPSAAFVPLTLEDVTEILRDAGYTDSSEPEVPDEPLPFLDVPADAFYHDPVAWAVKNGITNGLSDTRFGPDAACSRAQVVTFLWRAAGSPNPTTTEHGFVDVEAGSFYEKAVLWAVENGITTGTDAFHFSPEKTCSRAHVVTFLYRAFGSPDVENVENPFSDVPADTWYTAPVLWAVENGITTGTGNGLFGVEGVCNRAQIVTFLYRAYN